MPEAVVDLLEVVEIDEQEGKILFHIGDRVAVLEETLEDVEELAPVCRVPSARRSLLCLCRSSVRALSPRAEIARRMPAARIVAAERPMAMSPVLWRLANSSTANCQHGSEAGEQEATCLLGD